MKSIYNHAGVWRENFCLSCSHAALIAPYCWCFFSFYYYLVVQFIVYLLLYLCQFKYTLCSCMFHFCNIHWVKFLIFVCLPANKLISNSPNVGNSEQKMLKNITTYFSFWGEFPRRIVPWVSILDYDWWLWQTFSLLWC